VDLVVIDKALGMRAIGEFLTNLQEGGLGAPGIVVWGAAISPAEAGSLLHAGVRGVHLKTAELFEFSRVPADSCPGARLDGGMHIEGKKRRLSEKTR